MLRQPEFVLLGCLFWYSTFFLSQYIPKDICEEDSLCVFSALFIDSGSDILNDPLVNTPKETIDHLRYHANAKDSIDRYNTRVSALTRKS